MKRFIQGLFLAIIIVLVISFSLKNNQPVQLHYYFDSFQFSVPLYAVIFLSMLIGIFLGLSIGFSKWLTRGRLIKQLQRENTYMKEKFGSSGEANTEGLGTLSSAKNPD